LTRACVIRARLALAESPQAALYLRLIEAQLLLCFSFHLFTAHERNETARWRGCFSFSFSLKYENDLGARLGWGEASDIFIRIA
jgi:hypothetical protein